MEFMRFFSLSPSLNVAPVRAVALLLLVGCNPTYNWREVHGSPIPYTVTLPAKPTSISRPINLDGMQVTMNMTAAEVNGTTFAVGTAELPDVASAQRSVASMKTALVRNIRGTIKHEKTWAATSGLTVTEIEASGAPGNGREAKQLFARFAAKDKYIYQVVAAGDEKRVSREAVDTFLTSFKPE